MKANRYWILATTVGLALAGCSAKDMDGKVVSVPGSYAKTCRNVLQQAGGVLSADCMDAQGQFHSSTVPSGACPGQVANVNGVLTCPAKP